CHDPLLARHRSWRFPLPSEARQFLAHQNQRTVPFDIRGRAKSPSTSDLYTRRSESAFRSVRTIVVWLLRVRGWPSRAKRRGIHLEILVAFLRLPCSKIALTVSRMFHDTLR